MTIESPFEITLADGRVVTVVPETSTGAEHVLVALHDEVVEAEFDESGWLRIVMKRSTWFVKPDLNYESWQLGSSHGSPSRIVSGPGESNVAIWS